MAPQSNSKLLLLLLTLTALFFFSASARPCKILVSSYSFSLKPRHNRDHILYSSSSSSSSSGYFTVMAEIGPLYSSEISRVLRSGESSSQIPLLRAGVVTVPLGLRPRLQHIQGEPRPVIPLGFSFYDSTSLRDRAKDILNVLFALLIGASCGAITATAMYVLWYFFYFVYEHRDEEEYEEDASDGFSPKKMGYVKIPATDSVPEPVKTAV